MSEAEKDTEVTEKEKSKSKKRLRSHQAADSQEEQVLHAPRGVNICPSCRAEYRHDGEDCGSHE